MNLFFDFDGTLVDVMKRDYVAYCVASKSNNVDYREYVQRRRRRDPITHLLPSDVILHDFLKKREEIIESIDLLSLDEIFPDSIQFLDKASENKCHIVSARRSEKNLIEQCVRLGIEKYFSSISAVENPAKKSEIIKDIAGHEPRVMFGDTEHDILAARLSSSTAVSVTTGIRDFETLKRENPDFLVERLGDLLECTPSIYSRLEMHSMLLLKLEKDKIVDV